MLICTSIIIEITDSGEFVINQTNEQGWQNGGGGTLLTHENVPLEHNKISYMHAYVRKKNVPSHY